MAILGGGIGGAGNPVGGSFTGPAEALEVIGDHAYAFNSDPALGTGTTTALDFRSGNFYWLGEVNFNFNSSGFTAGERIGYQVTMNGSTIVDAVYGDNIQSPSGNPQTTTILIPPYSEIVVSWVNSDDSGIGVSMGMVGRIYRTRD